MQLFELNGLCAIIVFLVPMFIYLDATEHNIGKVGNDRRFLNAPAAAWAILCVILWILAVPLYLFNRKKLIQRAKEFPVSVGIWHRITVVILLTAAQWFLFQFFASDQPAATDTASNTENATRIQNFQPISFCSTNDFIIENVITRDEDNSIHIVGEVRSKCKDAAGALLQAVFRDSSGQVIKVSEFYPANMRNINPESVYPFDQPFEALPTSKKLELKVIGITKW